MNYREQVLDIVRLLARPSEQLQYERDVPIADVPAEMISMFADDLFHPKSSDFVDAFTEQELKLLAELYGLLTIAAKAFAERELHTVPEVLKSTEWRSVMTCAKNLEADLERVWS